MILTHSKINREGEFHFSGNELADELSFYKIHFADPSTTPIYMTGTPNKKNYFTFLLSNKDSIFVQLQSSLYSIGEITYESSVSKNQELLVVTSQLDKFEVAQDNAENSNHQQLIIEKKKKYAIDQIASSKNEAANLYTLYCSHLEIDKHSDSFLTVADQLQKGTLREVYRKTLEEYIGSKFYQKLKTENDQIRKLFYGMSVLSLVLFLTAIFLYFYSQKIKVQTSESKSLALLTNKEKEVMELIKTGLTNKEVAAKLFISESTVKTHINNIYRKTKVKSRAEIKLFKS